MKLERVLALTSVTLLAGAFIYGRLARGNDVEERVRRAFSELQLIDTSTPGLYAATPRGSADGALAGHVALGVGNGWGGPLKTAIWLDTTGRIQRVEILEHVETASFLRKVLTSGYLNHIEDLSIENDPPPNVVLDGVSGATMTSKGLLRSVLAGTHRTGRVVYGATYERPTLHIGFGQAESALIILYAFVIVAVLLRKTQLRPLGYLGGFLVVGVLASTPLSLASLAGLAMGYVPGLEEHLFWWLLAIGAVGGPIVLRKNIYCSWVCPFAALEELLSRVGGVRLRVRRSVSQYFRYATLGLLWLALFLAFIKQNPSMATYEPFFIFSLTGENLQWYLASLALLGSFFVPKFWCRFFCPVGEILTGLVKLRARITRQPRKRLPIVG